MNSIQLFCDWKRRIKLFFHLLYMTIPFCNGLQPYIKTYICEKMSSESNTVKGKENRTENLSDVCITYIKIELIGDNFSSY
jgi:hypothetical protein